MRLVLPQDVVDELELRYMGSAYVAGADGPARAAAAGRAGHGPDRRRSTTTDCLVGPAGSQAVVGHVVLAMLDLVADEAGTLRPRDPDGPVLSLKTMTNETWVAE
jgi:hypothetical protein